MYAALCKPYVTPFFMTDGLLLLLLILCLLALILRFLVIIPRWLQI